MLVVDKQGKVLSLQARGGELDRLLDRLLGPACVPTGRLTSIDLQPKANIGLTESIEGSERPNNLAELPQGEQVLAGVKFAIGKNLILLDAKHLSDKLRKAKAEAIPVDKKFTRLYILHGTVGVCRRWHADRRVPIALPGWNRNGHPHRAWRGRPRLVERRRFESRHSRDHRLGWSKRRHAAGKFEAPPLSSRVGQPTP